MEAAASRWGDEIFFETGLEPVPGAGLTLDVNIGDICFYPPARALCIFFGRTPASVIDKPVPEGPVEIIGKTAAQLEGLKSIKHGDRIAVSVYKEPVPPTVLPPAGERKLNQGEIDDLVKRLLVEKKKGTI